MTTGQLIKAARKQAGLTQKELGERLGITYQTIAQWENDLRNPKSETLMRIAGALDVAWTDLVPEEDMHKYRVKTLTFDITPLSNETFNTLLLSRSDKVAYKAILKIDEALIKMNHSGINEAVKRVEELTEIPRYQATAASESAPPARSGEDEMLSERP